MMHLYLLRSSESELQGTMSDERGLCRSDLVTVSRPLALRRFQCHRSLSHHAPVTSWRASRHPRIASCPDATLLP